MRSGAYEVKVADKGEYALAQHIADGRLNASNVKQNLKDRSLNLTVVPARRLTNSSRPSAVLSPENLFPANVQEHRAEAMARNYDLNGGTHSGLLWLGAPLFKEKNCRESGDVESGIQRLMLVRIGLGSDHTAHTDAATYDAPP